MSVLLLIARLLLAAVFVVSGLAKIVDLKGSQKAVQGFGVPSFLAVPLGTLLPFAELAVAVALIPSSWAWYGAIGALALLFAFIVGISVNLSFGRKPDCHCFGQLHSEPVGASTLIRNTLLAAIAGAVIWQGAAYNNIGPSAVNWIATLTVAQGIELVVGLILVALVGIETWLLLQTMTQQGKLLTRLELLEENGVPGNENNQQYGLPEDSVAPTFELPDLTGSMVSLSDLLARGADKKAPVVLVFTSPTCNPCTAMLPRFAEWQQKYQGEVTLVIVGQGTAEENLAKIAEYDISPVLLQQDREVAEAYKARGTPSAAAIRFDGSTIGKLAEGEDEIRELLENLMEEVESYVPHPLLEVNRPDNGRIFPEPPAIGEPAPDLTLLDLDQNPIKLSDFRGTPTLLLFWNPGCTFCQGMLKDLLVWERNRPRGAPQLLVISTGGTKKDNLVGFKSPIVLDETQSNFSAQRWFKSTGTPMAVLLDENGIVISELVGGARAVLELTQPVRHRTKKVATV
ncbi:MAG TPA: MauE/DoxX family redox-associated membrane protein [Ktedonobacteraceae bacterium]|nr:MauE/DoxX family redox-associated membrane protein [Ktedonobacteraceae bacterium]